MPQSPLTIGIDIRCLMNGKYSGVGEYTHHLLSHLLSTDRTNQYILFYNSQKDVSKNIPAYDYPNVKIKQFRYPNKILNARFAVLQSPKIDRMLFGVDIMFFPNINFAVVSKNCKKIITAHDLSFERFPDFFSLKRQLWHKAIRPRNMFCSADTVIAVSQNTKRDLMDLYNIPDEKIKVIYSGIDPAFKKITKTEKLARVREKYKLPDDFILYLGTIEPRKNTESIIQAFEMVRMNNAFKKYELVIAGQTGWKYDHIIAMANESQASESIHFTDYVDPKDKKYIYNLSKLFVFPSFYEGFGFPPLEAQACGVPVISSANSSLCEILGNSALLVNPDDVTELSRAIQTFLEKPELCKQYIEKGFENIKRFSWEQTATQTLKLFQ